MKIFTLSAVFFLFAHTVFAQVTGNEWINFNQSYYKVNVGQDGIYRVSYSAMQAAGAPVGTIDPRNIKLYYRGQEQYLYVQGEADGSFDNGDYLEFFGKKNDGALDSLLFKNPKDQAHQYFSFYTDTSSYFITWNTTSPGKRFSVYFNNDYSGTKEPYYMREVVDSYMNVYYDGRVPDTYSDFLKLSYYTDGEGWFDNFFGFGSGRVKNVSTLDLFAAGPNATIEVGITGVSNALKNDLTPAPYNHHLKVEVSPGNNSYVQIAEDTFKGVTNRVYTATLNNTSIGNTTRVRAQAINDLDVRADNNAYAYVKVIYPAQFNLRNNSQWAFNYSGGNNNFIEWKNYPAGKTNPVFYDLTNGRKVYGTMNGNLVNVNMGNISQKSQYFLSDSTDAIDLKPVAVNFIDYKTAVPSNLEFLIFTHPVLNSSAQAYHNFRSQEFTTYTVYTPDLYDQFMYGNHHPVALRRFADYLIKEGKQPEHVLLLGKGLSQAIVRLGNNINLNYVPTMGEPPTDNLLFAGLGNSVLETPFTVGRIAATTNGQVLSYLEKLKENEGIDVALWKKHLLHLSGGRAGTDEAKDFNHHLNRYAALAKGPYYGASITHLGSNDAVPYPHQKLRDYIINKMDSGVGLSNYFGHGAADILEIDIGEPSQYNNKGKYPVMYFTGCILGNSYNDRPAMGEKFIFEPEKGAVAWIAGTSYGFINYLAKFSDVFYKKFVIEEYGKPAGTILRETIKEYQSPGNLYNEMQCLQTTYQGDPAATLYDPGKPDYVLKEENVFTSQINSGGNDSSLLGIIVLNTGKAIDTTIHLNITRNASGGITDTIYHKAVQAPYNRDTIWVMISSGGIAGVDNIEIFIDSEEIIDEINEDNNKIGYSHYIISDNAAPHYPPAYGIVSKTEVELIALNYNIHAQNVTYEYEIDTVPDFSSTWKKSSGTVTAGNNARWQVTLLPFDTTAYYWRVRRAGAQNEWQTSSFSYIKNSPEGWAQVHFQQFEESISMNNMQPDSQGRFHFDRNASPSYRLQTAGDQIFPSGSNRYIRFNYGKMWFWNDGNGFYVVAINPDDLTRYHYPSTFNYMACNPALDWNHPCPTTTSSSGVFHFNWVINSNNTINQSVVDSFKQFIANVPDGYYVLGLTGIKHLIADLDSGFFNTMESLGATEIRNVQNGWPYLFVGQKGSAPGSALEQTADTNNQFTPPASQDISTTLQLYPRTTAGSLTSAKIGPSMKWKRFYSNYTGTEPTGADTVTYTIYGIDNSNSKTELMQIPHGQLDVDISHIDAQTYPFLQIEAHFNDSVRRTPAQIQNWVVLYDYLPEASLRPDIHYTFQHDTLPEGDTVKFSIAITNISAYNMDSVLMRYTVLDENRNQLVIYDERIAPLQAWDTVIYSGQFSSAGMLGAHSFRLVMNPDNDQPEQHFFNNVLQRNFYVEGDRMNPVLEVTFDGRRLRDGDIISPSPVIEITLRDENEFYLLNDTSLLDVYLLYPNTSTPVRIWHSGNNMEFLPATKGNNKATVLFTPENLPDGRFYELIVEARDVKGNRFAPESYSIRFQIVSEQSVGYFKVYPNPFNICTRFEFLLRGSEVPDQLQVVISDLSGRLVEIITIPKQEMHIGLNRPATCWDGTKADGSQLPNGMYIYRVNALKNGESIKFNSSGYSGMFIEDVGKIIIAR